SCWPWSPTPCSPAANAPARASNTPRSSVPPRPGRSWTDGGILGRDRQDRRLNPGENRMNALDQQDLGKRILRLTLAILFLFQAIAKLSGGVAGIEGTATGAGLPSVLAEGVLLGEVVGRLLVIFAFYARIGAILIAINMLFAIGL